VLPQPLLVKPIEKPSTDVHPTIRDIQRRGTITFLMDHSAASYFLYRGGQMGFEYELAEAFAQDIGVELEVRTPPPGTTLTALFNEGVGDVVAGLVIADGVGVGPLQASVPYLETSAEIITNSAYSFIRSMADLSGKRLAIPPRSTYAHVLRTYTPAPTSTLLFSPLHESEPLHEGLNAVAQKRATATIVIEPLAALAHRLYPGKLRTVLALPAPVRLVWAVRPGQADLLNAINAHLKRTEQSGLKKILFEKYFVTANHLRTATRVAESTLMATKRLSRYDRVIARHAEEAGFDWRLVAALIFEESRFDHSQVSEAGAFGLMQLLPTTAQLVGVKNYLDPHENIGAGVKYLRSLARRFPYGQPQDRLALILASYVMGPGHVEDAQRLALSSGYDPHCWPGSMEKVLPLLEKQAYRRRTVHGFAQGREAVRYVNAILKRYNLYSQYIARDLIPTKARTAALRLKPLPPRGKG
jgi:membrane-bound lytic murein transglycosylase F